MQWNRAQVEEAFKASFPRKSTKVLDLKKPITQALVRRILSKATYNARDTHMKKSMTPDDYQAWKAGKKKSAKIPEVGNNGQSVQNKQDKSRKKVKRSSKAIIDSSCSSDDDSSCNGRKRKFTKPSEQPILLSSDNGGKSSDERKEEHSMKAESLTGSSSDSIDSTNTDSDVQAIGDGKGIEEDSDTLLPESPVKMCGV